MPLTNNANIPSVTVNGMTFNGWESLSIRRRLDRMTAQVQATIAERSASVIVPSQTEPFSPCVFKIDSDTVLTGYIDEYHAMIGPEAHTVRIGARSKTADLIDCSPDFPSGQFQGYNLEQIARSVANIFNISVVVQTPADYIFRDATLQRGETGLRFLERLARLSRVLLTDDGYGNLVLTTAGTTRAAGTLMQGVNIMSASVKLDVKKRFSIYIVKGQNAIGSAIAANAALAGFGSAGASHPVAPVITNQRATSTDSGVPRYRPTVTLAEAQLDQAGMQGRADWERNFAFGRATEVQITVQGWRQSDGSLWQINQLIAVDCPALHIGQDLLVVGVDFRFDSQTGRTTVLELGPLEGYTPEPGQVRLHTKKGKGGTIAALSGFGIP